jgi:BTB/POZ domain.
MVERNGDKLEDSFKPHADFWFVDGSVVIIVEATSFKIHQSVLSRHSDVFSGMFTVPQPARDDTIDGCPVVVLSQDKASDFVDVLKALYLPLYVTSRQ